MSIPDGRKAITIPTTDPRSMFELVFRDRRTGYVTHTITEVTLIRYITPSEVGFVDKTGHSRSSSFTHAENLDIQRMGQ